jgi:hypothetical protein
MNTALKPSQLAKLLAQTIKAKLPVLITGAPGIGKTDVVTQAAAAAKADLVVSHPVVSDPTDYKGMPWVIDGRATFLPFGDLDLLINAKKLTLAFADDLGQASPSVQAAYMQLQLARRINGHKISDHVVFCAATNRRSDRAGVSGILEPVKSRFATIVELQADLNDWCEWAASHGVAPEVIAFLRFRPAHLSCFKPTADMTNSPSPRTWHHVSKLHQLGLDRDLQLSTFAGAIGPEIAPEFTGFLRIWADMVSPDVVLTTPDTAPIPVETSTLWALSTALSARVASASMVRYVKYLERLIKAGKAEFSALSMKAAIARDPKLANTPGYIQAMSGPLGNLMIGAQS